MEALKKKKKLRNRSGQEEAQPRVSTCAKPSEAGANQNVVECAEESLDVCINSSELSSPTSSTNISLQHVGQVLELNGNSTKIQETALTEGVSTLPSAPVFEILGVELCNTLVMTDSKPSTSSVPFTSTKIRHEYEPLSEVALLDILNSNFKMFSLINETLLDHPNHPFHKKMDNFLRVHRKMQTNLLFIEKTKTQLNYQLQNVWRHERKSVMETGECQDGNPVFTELECVIFHFNQTDYEAYSQALNDFKDHCHQEVINTSHCAELQRQKISAYVDNVAYNCLCNITVQNSVQLLTSVEQSKIREHISELRICIGILFMFYRRKICSHDSYYNILKQWVTKLVDVLHKVGTSDDHIFLLKQILSIQGRLPDWIKQLFQVPLESCKTLQSPFESQYLAHMIKALSTLLHPIPSRSIMNEGDLDFGYEMDARQDEHDSSWVLVDSDGEDDLQNTQQRSAKDINDLFNQLPLEKMFMHILKISKLDNRYALNTSQYDDRYMIELLAFCTLLVKELDHGLDTYGNTHHQQFAKRLAQLIRHTAQYVTEAYESYTQGITVGINSTSWPLQCEYDMFIIRCVNAIYSCPNLGMWQFLATVPFSKISTSSLWRIYGLLHKEYNDYIDVNLPTDEQEWDQYVKEIGCPTTFEDRLCVLQESDCIYLLTAFSFMALPSQELDDDLQAFVRTVTLELFQIGFGSTVTLDRFSKHVKTLLSSITAQFPTLISDILNEMVYFNFVDAESSCLDLFRELPLTYWVPKDEDLVIISRWLLDKPLLSTEFSLARLILANLNYNINVDENSCDDLVLSHKFHCTVGVLVVKAALRSVPEQPSHAASNTAAICDMVYKYVAPATGLEVIMKWAWRILSLLRIHCIDRGKTVPRDTIVAPEVFLQSVPDLYAHDDLQEVATGVLRSQPIASYLALLMTTWGHNVPLICSKGFALVDVIVRNQCYREALKCIHLLVPLFLRCPESLIQCDMFRTIIVTLYGADKSFLKLSKPFSSSSDFPGYYLRHLGSLICVHIADAESSHYGSDALEPMICMWLKCLTKIPDWIHDMSTLYLIDIILGQAFYYCSTYCAAIQLLSELYMPSLLDMEKEEVLNKPEYTTVEMFLQFTKKTVHPPIQSLMAKMSLPTMPWFAFCVLTIEKNWQETSCFWACLQLELFEQTGKTNVDMAVKGALMRSNVPVSIPAGSIAIYRFANQALDTPIGHLSLPFMWQMFFMMYLSRVPADPCGSKGGVGHKFFEGTVEQNLLKRMKKQLLDTAAYYAAREAHLRDTSKDDPVLQRESQKEILQLSKMSKLFKTFHLWIEDQHLMESNVILPNLEAMYDIPKLKAIFSSDLSLWVEFFMMKEYHDNTIKTWTNWDELMYRHVEPRNQYVNNERRVPSNLERTSHRLSSYEAPTKLEEAVVDIQPVVPVIPAEVMLYKETLLNFVKEQFDILANIGQMYMLNLAEHTALDCAVLEFLPSLYSNVETEKILSAECHSSPPHRGREYHARQSTCAGPAEIRVIVTESQICEPARECIAENRTEWWDVVRRVMRSPKLETCHAITTLDMLGVNILKEYDEANTDVNPQRKIVAKELAVTYFFYLIEYYTESVTFFPPTEAMMRSLLQLLAEPFVRNGSYVEQLLMAILEKPRLVPILSPYLVPVEAKTSTFLQLYGIVLKKAYESQPDENTYAAILEKFSIDEWLKKHRTTFAERCMVIDEVAAALEAAGLQPDPRNEKVHVIIRQHFVTLLRYDFPGHFGKILSLLLGGSSLQRISVEVWYDFINALFGENKLSLGCDMSKVKEDIRIFATEQKSLSYTELIQTIHMVARYFLVERNLYGLYGLYPKYRTYVEPIMVFQAMIHHSFIVATLSQEQGALSSTICEKVWPALDEIYSPWIAPLQTEHMSEPPAAWIDQLAEDRSVLLPWIPPDLLHANKAVMMFVESIRFILDTVSGEILSYLWQYYVAKFVHKSITENVLSVVQSHMELLPWQQFRPCLLDMELMFKVLTQSVPTEVYAFLGTIFVKVAWAPWLNYMIHNYRDNCEVQTKLHVYMLHLHVKLSRDSDVRKWSKVNEMLSCAKKFDWHFVDASSYAQVLDWWVFKYDPRVAAGLPEPYVNPIDICVMQLLEVAGGFSTEMQRLHPTTSHKRILFVRAKVKMLIRCSNGERGFVEKHVNDVSLTLLALLSTIENIAQRTVKEECRLDECSLLIKEVVVIFNQPENSELRKVALKVCSSWLTKENCMSIVVQGFLRVVGTDVTNSATMGQLLEICLHSYFKHTVMQVCPPSWNSAAQLMSAPMVPNIEDALLSGGYFLTLHTILYQQVSSTKSIREELTLLSNLVDWICLLKAATIEEAKLPLLWGVALLLISRQCQFSESLLSVTRSIKRLITHFLEASEEKGQLWNLLGTFGIRKIVNLSPKGRLLCRAMAVFLLAQLPDGGDQLIIRMEANAPGAIAGSQESSEGTSGPTPSGEAVRALRDLEAIGSSKSYAELKDTLDLALQLIKDPMQSIITARQFLGKITVELFTEQYLYVLTM